MNEEIRFRNTASEGSFRFHVSSDLWDTIYEFDKGTKASNIVSVTKDGVLKGYAVYFVFVRGPFKQLSVLDLCVDDESTLAEIVEILKKRASDEDADLIYVRKPPDPIDRLFSREGFISSTESVIMLKLLNPHDLLHALSREVNGGKNLKLFLEGFEPLLVQVDKKGIKVLTEGVADLTVSTDSCTFLRLVFCRTSFWKELLRGKIKASRVIGLSTAKKFFDAVKQKKWYIPFGDWV